jgi:hypothetical protein
VYPGLAGAVVAGAAALPGLLGAGDEPQRVAGTLERCARGYCLSGEPVDFGLARGGGDARAPHDYDGDGVTETMVREVDGLVRQKEVMLELSPDADAGNVLTVQGLPYRSGSGSPGATADGEPARAHEPAEPRWADGTALTTHDGRLVECGGGYCVEVGDTLVPVDFGPRWWLQATVLETEGDLDGDTVSRSLAEEIAGLVGRQVVVEVEDGRDGDAADVHVLNGVRYRGKVDEPPPWAGGPRVERPRRIPPVAPEPEPPAARAPDEGPTAQVPPPPPPEDPDDETESGGPPPGVPTGPPEDAGLANGLLGGPPPGGPGSADAEDEDDPEGGRPAHAGGPPQSGSTDPP